MALSIVNTQLTKMYIVALGTAVTTPAEISTAISGGSIVGGIQTLGEVGSSRNITEYSALDVDETTKSFGSITLGNISLSLLFDADDTAGQDELRTMFSTNTKRTFIIKLTDDGAVSPSYLTFDGGLSSEMMPIEKDSAVLYNVTLELTSKPVLVKKTDI